MILGILDKKTSNLLVPHRFSRLFCTLPGLHEFHFWVWKKNEIKKEICTYVYIFSLKSLNLAFSKLKKSKWECSKGPGKIRQKKSALSKKSWYICLIWIHFCCNILYNSKTMYEFESYSVHVFHEKQIFKPILMSLVHLFVCFSFDWF